MDERWKDPNQLMLDLEIPEENQSVWCALPCDHLECGYWTEMDPHPEPWRSARSSSLLGDAVRAVVQFVLGRR